MGRKNILPMEGLISEALSLTSLFFIKSGKSWSIMGTICVINASSNALTEKILIRTQNQAGLSGVFNYLSHAGHE